MNLKTRFFPFFILFAFAAVLALTSNTYGGETADSKTSHGPWAYNLSIYGWLPGINGKFSAGPFSRSIDTSFIDIAGKLRSFPLAFNGRFEGYYERLGFYLDGNYMDMKFKPRFDGGISKGLSSQIGIMEYGAKYRLFGSSASEHIDHWDEKPSSNMLELYAGGRTIWLTNQLDFNGIGSASASKSATSPLLGGRFTVEFSPKWFVLVDGNAGGFGMDNVNFAGSVLGSVGYRTRMFGIPASVEAGYKALRLNVNKRVLETNVTMNGVFFGLTGYW